MTYNLYAIKDTVTELFATPYLGENDSAATRAFMLDKSKQPFADDFALYLLGTYDPATAVIKSTPGGKPVLICDGEIIDAARKNGDVS